LSCSTWASCTGRRAIGVGEALWLSLGYIVLALLFAGGVYWFLGRQASVEFLTGYFIEKSLSIDNIFVFVLIFSNFGVPAAYQHRVLFWGVLGALALRAVLVFVGVQLLHAFAWMTLVFGAFLVITGIRMLFAAEGTPDLHNNTVLKLLRRRLPVTEDYEGATFLVRRDGALYVTPLFLVLARSSSPTWCSRSTPSRRSWRSRRTRSSSIRPT